MLAMVRLHPRSGGFSLIELLIVVTIILILAAIAIPKLMTVKALANESAAVSDLHVIQVAEMAYSGAYQGFSSSLTVLGGTPGQAPTASNAQLLQPQLAQTTPDYNGYTFTYNPQGTAPYELFTLNADPELTGVTGVRHFFTDQTAVVHYKVGGAASASDPVL